MGNGTKGMGKSPLTEEKSITNLIENPSVLEGWGIVVTNWDISKPEKEWIKSQYKEKKNSKTQPPLMRPEDASDVYSNWGDQAEKFPLKCIAIHLYESENIDVRALSFGRGEKAVVVYGGEQHGKCLFSYRLGWKENIESIKAVEFKRDCRVKNLLDYWKNKHEGKIYAMVKEFVTDLKELPRSTG